MVNNRCILFVIISLIIYSCNTTSKRHPTFDQKRVLWYYKLIDRNPEKYEAAKFLIDNLSYHYSRGHNFSIPKELESWRIKTDSAYFSLVNGCSLDSFPSDSIKVLKKEAQEQLKNISLSTIENQQTLEYDYEWIDFDFLTDHIDHAFDVWKTSKYASHLSFDEFKEYILPYRSINLYGFTETGKHYHELFGKYLPFEVSDSLGECIAYYNRTINNLRAMGGKTERQKQAGYYDLYTRDFTNCIDIASNGCNILRSCGLPVVVEFNVCYTNLIGRHYHCSVFDTNTRNWQTFNPESSLPGHRDWAFDRTLNLYRITFEPQKNTPYFLKGKDEYVPDILNDPCIKDVTSNVRKTTSLTLPFNVNCSNNLAYLATFNRDANGQIPVTWGIINKKDRTVTFNHVVPDALYFPIYYNGDAINSFGAPFYLEISEGKDSICKLLNTNDNKLYSDLYLTRKYPRKKNMIKIAENLVGGRFLGANKKDFSDAVVLYEITEPPQPYFLEYKFQKIGKYQYYRFQSPSNHPHANISRLEWITSSHYKYTNTAPPSRPYVLNFQQAQELLQNSDTTKVQLLDAPLEKSLWKSEYDGNMLTAPGAYPNITLWLKEPQIVESVRFAPKNANNGINCKDRYELYYWENGWKYHSSIEAQYEYLIFSKVPKDKLYWLKNTTKGQEECPFIMKDGQQRFLYQDIIPM